MRVLATGSREFSALAVIRAALDVINEQPGPHTLVHGAAKGADQMAAQVALRMGWRVEPHPADWKAPCVEQCKHKPRGKGRYDFCAAAGARRNNAMVVLGADLCLTFFAAGALNAGTTDCSKRAVAAGIDVLPFADQPGFKFPAHLQGVLL